MDKIIAIIPASGIGSRFHYSRPKQYFSIFGKTILEYTIELLAQNNNIDLILLNISEDDIYYDSILPKFVKIIDNFNLKNKRDNLCPLIAIKKGGDTRSQTIKNAIQFLYENKLASENDWILVHDAVRCTLPINLLEEFIINIIKYNIGGIMAIPVMDTLKKVENNHVISTINRENIFQAQTPQMFKLHILIKAFENINFRNFTDESSLVENLNINPIIVKGDLQNLKITRYEDIQLVKVLLSNRVNNNV